MKSLFKGTIRIAVAMAMMFSAHADNPITITQGGVYYGSWSSDNPAVAAVTIATTGMVEIAFSTISSRGNGIYTAVPHSSVIVHDCFFVARNSQVYGVPNGFGIMDYCMSGVQFFRNYFKDWRTAIVCMGVGKPGSSLFISNNQIRDCEGRRSNGNGWYLADENGKSNGGAIELNGIDGAIFADISWNEIINTPGASSAADQISVYACAGTPKYPVSVHDNYIRGMFPADPSVTISVAAGIQADGDPSGNQGCWYVDISNNIVVDFCGGGIGISYSHCCTAESNTVVSASVNPWTGQIYAERYLIAGLAVYKADSTNVIKNNLSGVNQSSTETQALGPRADTASTWPTWMPWGTYLNNISLPAGPISVEDEDNLFGAWKEKVHSANQQIGPW
jgi:hypothetical protein